MAVGIPRLRAVTLQQALQGLQNRPKTEHRCFVQATQQVQAPQTQAIQAPGQIYIQTLQTHKQNLEDFIFTHENAHQGFKASTIVLAVVQGFARIAVTGLGIAAATLDHPPKVLNVLTAALGAVGTGVVPLSKWRDSAGKTTFNEEAMSVFLSSRSRQQPVNIV